MKNDDKEYHERVKEIKELYDISEAEEILLLQMIMMIKMLGFSSKLSVKLLRTSTAIMEMIHELDTKDEASKK